MSNLSFWWASTSTEYYLNYLANIQKVTRADVQAYLQKYVHARYFLTSIWIHKDDDQKHGIMQEAEKVNRQFATTRGD
jgi:zinc protease